MSAVIHSSTLPALNKRRTFFFIELYVNSAYSLENYVESVFRPSVMHDHDLCTIVMGKVFNRWFSIAYLGCFSPGARHCGFCLRAYFVLLFFNEAGTVGRVAAYHWLCSPFFISFTRHHILTRADSFIYTTFFNVSLYVMGIYIFRASRNGSACTWDISSVPMVNYWHRFNK